MRSRWLRRAASGLGGLVIVLVGLSQAPPPARAQTLLQGTPSFGPGRVYKRVRSVSDMRWHRLVRQTRDITCAAASVATLRTYYFRQRTSEVDALRDLVRLATQNQSQSKARKFGFSMLDMKEYFEEKGFEAGGYGADPSSLKDLPIPVIALIEIRGFPHYVVLKGVREGIVYLADPLFGNISMKLSTFSRSWEGVFLATIRKGKPLPVFNPLGVISEDRIGLGDQDVDRVSTRSSTPFGVLRLPNSTHAPLLQQTPIFGIESALPSVDANFIDFKGWGG